MEGELTHSGTAASDQQTVIFNLGEEHYGIDIFRVNEIIRMREITPVPGSEPHVLGLINLRGKTIPVLNLCTKLELASRETTERTRIIVVEAQGEKIGMIVDGVSEVITVQEADLEAPPEMVSDNRTDYVWALAKRDDLIITLVDLDRALAA